MKLRPGNAGSNTFTDHQEVLTAAIRQVPGTRRRKMLVRVDGAGASHDLISHLLSLSYPHRIMRFACGLDHPPRRRRRHPDAARGRVEARHLPGRHHPDGRGSHAVAHLMSRAENSSPAACGWIVRRVEPSRRQLAKLTPYEKQTSWPYPIICTNIPDASPAKNYGSHHAQFIDVLHREHACIERTGVRTAKDMGLRACPSKAFQVDEGWVLAANITADLAGLDPHLLLGHDDQGLRDANPPALAARGPGAYAPARLARHARQRILAISRDWPWQRSSSPVLLDPLMRPPRTHPNQRRQHHR